jgi:HPt (histidine-containing phosphotransfer) domain-containing protein
MESVTEADDETRVAGVRARLADLTEGDPTPAETALLLRLLGSFEGRAQEAADVLADLLRHGDLADVRDQAHSLKGSAANIGATRLAGLCAAVEDQARAGRLADPRHTAARLHTEVAGALRAVSRLAGELRT